MWLEGFSAAVAVVKVAQSMSLAELRAKFGKLSMLPAAFQFMRSSDDAQGIDPELESDFKAWLFAPKLWLRVATARPSTGGGGVSQQSPSPPFWASKSPASRSQRPVLAAEPPRSPVAAASTGESPGNARQTRRSSSFNGVNPYWREDAAPVKSPPMQAAAPKLLERSQPAATPSTGATNASSSSASSDRNPASPVVEPPTVEVSGGAAADEDGGFGEELEPEVGREPGLEQAPERDIHVEAGPELAPEPASEAEAEAEAEAEREREPEPEPEPAIDAHAPQPCA